MTREEAISRAKELTLAMWWKNQHCEDCAPEQYILCEFCKTEYDVEDGHSCWERRAS